MTAISNGVDVITPQLVTNYQSTSAVQTIVHDIIGREDPDVNYQPAHTRTGTLELLIVDELDAAAAETALRAPGAWTLTDPDRPSVGMRFVVYGGGVERELEPETRDLWLVRVPFREVAG